MEDEDFGTIKTTDQTHLCRVTARILCQKITKELVLVAQDIEGEKAKADLRITMQLGTLVSDDFYDCSMFPPL